MCRLSVRKIWPHCIMLSEKIELIYLIYISCTVERNYIGAVLKSDVPPA